MLQLWASIILDIRAVARSEILWGLVVLGGDNVSPLVEIGLADLPNIGAAKAPPSPHLATALFVSFSCSCNCRPCRIMQRKTK